VFHFQFIFYKVVLNCESLLVYDDVTYTIGGACGSVVGRGTMLQAGRSRVRIPMR
jgi:hypothetical protein